MRVPCRPWAFDKENWHLYRKLGNRLLILQPWPLSLMDRNNPLDLTTTGSGKSEQGRQLRSLPMPASKRRRLRSKNIVVIRKTRLLIWPSVWTRPWIKWKTQLTWGWAQEMTFRLSSTLKHRAYSRATSLKTMTITHRINSRTGPCACLSQPPCKSQAERTCTSWMIRFCRSLRSQINRSSPFKRKIHHLLSKMISRSSTWVAQ